MKPLVCEELRATRPSGAEKLLARLPVVGWPFAAALERSRIRPIVRSIERQLLDRPVTSDAWGPDPKRREIASAICKIIEIEFGWPNDHFIPDDPFAIAFWAHNDGLDDVCAVTRIEKEFGFRLSDSAFERLQSSGTLGEFVEFLIQTIRD